MKVAIFAYTEDAPSLDTGVTTYNRELTSELCTRFPSHSFSLYLAPKNSERFSDIEFANLRKIIVGNDVSWDAERPNRRPAGTGMWSFFSFVAREVLHRMGLVAFPASRPLYDSLRDLSGADLVIYTVFGHFADFPLYVKRRHAVPCISAIHDVRILYIEPRDLKSRLLVHKARYMLGRIVRESERCLVPSNYIRQLLLARYPDNASRVDVSYIVPDMRERSEADGSISPQVQNLVGGRRKYVFYPSTIVETKNHANLVRAIHLLSRDLPDVKLILAGSNTESELAKEIFGYVSSNELSANVIHLGFVSEAEKIALYRSAVALVVPSIGESFSLPIWEAFANGCAVVASTDRDIPEQVGDAAVLCDPSSPEDIAAKIKRVWLDDVLRVQLREMGRARYDQIRRTALFSGWESLLQ